MSTFAEHIHDYAARMREGESVALDELNATQQREVLRQVGDSTGVSPEGMAHAMEAYLNALNTQANVAKAFFLGHLQEGVEGLARLPEDVQLQIDQLIWEAAGGKAIDPTLHDAQNLIAAAIMHSVEMRMGMLD